MPNKRLIIELTPGGIDGAVIQRGRVARSAHVEIDPSLWRQAWEEGLSLFDGKLSELVNELGAVGCVAEVAYRSPSSFVEVIAVPATGSAALSAAHLAMADHVGFDLRTNPMCVHPVASATIKDVRVTHALAIADLASASNTLSEWVSRAGCLLSRACPSSALAMEEAVVSASGGKSSSVSARVFVDRHCSILTVSENGSVRLLRRIEIGIEDIVVAMTRPIVRNDSENESVSLKPARAREILCGSGVPGFKSIVDESLGLTGRDVLPLIQPVLQRLVIEIKQSLRFELTDAERDTIQIGFGGPFGATPNLAPMLCEQIEIPAGGVDQQCEVVASQPFMGDQSRAKQLHGLMAKYSLIAEEIESDQRFASITKGLRVGAVAAVLALSGIAYFTHTQIKEQRASVQRLDSAIGTIDLIVATNNEIQAKIGVLGATTVRINEAISASASWADTLSAMPALIPSTVVLTTIEGSEASENAGPRLDFAGVARGDGEQSGQAALNIFIESLNACPLVAGVELGATNRMDEADGAESLGFSIVVNLIPMPHMEVASVQSGAAN